MKKTFRFILAGVVAFLAVSCYDDSELRESIGKIDDRLTKIENTLNADLGGINNLVSRLSSAEAAIVKLNGGLSDLEGDIADLNGAISEAGVDFAALQGEVNSLLSKLDGVDGKVDGVVANVEKAVEALIEADKLFASKAELAAEMAKVAVVKVETIGENVVLTLANGDTVALSKPLSNVENSGLVTIVKELGVQYWAVKNPDGTVTSLGVPVGHPDVDIEFEVAKDGKLMYKVNGGDLHDTGLSTTGFTGYGYIINEFEVAEDGKTVSFTIGETEITLPMYNAKTATLTLSRDSFFLRYGAQKTVAIESENLTDIFVMNQPDGWKAAIKDGELVVNAPTSKAVSMGAAQDEGIIVIHANNEEGRCVTAKVEVTSGPGLTMSLKDGELNFRNAYTTVETDPYGEVIGETFSGFYVGVVAYDELEGIDMDEFFQYIAENYEAPAGAVGDMSNCYKVDLPWYEEGVCEVQEVSISMGDFYNWIAWDDKDGINPGVKYLVYAAPMDVDNMGAFIVDEVITLDYSLLISSAEATDITHNDAVLKLDLMGADKFIVGIMQDPAVMYGPAVTLEMVMNEMPPWSYIMYGYVDYIEGGIYMDGTYEVKASSFNYGDPLVAGCKYYYWAFPYVEGTVYNDFATQFLPYVKEFETAPLQAGGPATELVAGAEEYGKVNVTINAAENASQVKYSFYTASEWAEFDENEDAIRKDLFDYGDDAYSAKVYKSCNPGTTYVCAAISVSEDGKYGEVNYITVSSKTIVYDENIKVSLESLTLADNKYTAVFNVTGATKIAGYNIGYSASAASGMETNMAKQLGKYTQYQWTDVVDGKATVTFSKNDRKADYIVYGYTVDADGALAKLQKEPLVVNIATEMAK